MMGRLTNELEQFLDNNSPGGYVQTTINISSDDLSSRIQTILNNKNYLTSTSHIPYSQIDGTPTLANVAYSGEYGELKHLPELAPVAISGDYNDLRNKPTNNGIPTGGIPYESITGRPSLATVATSGLYIDLIDKPNLATVATTGNYDDLVQKPNFLEANDLHTHLKEIAFSGSYSDLDDTPDFFSVADNIVYNFNLTNVEYQPLQLLTNRRIDTQMRLTASNNDFTIENFLLDLIKIYYSYENLDDGSTYRANPAIIRLETTLGIMIVTGIKKIDDSFIFSFTPIDESVFQYTIEVNKYAGSGNDEQVYEILNKLKPKYFYPILIFIPNKHELWIKRMFTTLKEDLSTVALSGLYDDLENKPELAEVATSGKYVDLKGRPELKPVATTGSYEDLSDKPELADVATTGSYESLSDKPELADVATTGSYKSLSDKPVLADVATTGSYNSLSDRPVFPDVVRTGSYYSLPDRPVLADVATTGSYNSLSDRPVIAEQKDIIQIFDVSNFSSNLLKNFSPGEIITTGKTTDEPLSRTINVWLEDIINAYEKNNEVINNIIKIKNTNMQMILTYLEKLNNIYTFYFTPITNNNITELINNNTAITSSNVTFVNSYIYFVYDKNKDKLFIYKI